MTVKQNNHSLSFNTSFFSQRDSSLTLRMTDVTVIFIWEDSDMKKGLTEIVMILDASGSMHGLEKDTIGGFNSIIESQKK